MQLLVGLSMISLPALAEGITLIGAGFGRTGTSSTMEALEILGIEPVHHMTKVLYNFELPYWARVSRAANKVERQEALRAALTGYSAAIDFPSCAYYKDLIEMYPDAKVLLTTRSPESWYNSAWDTILLFKRYESPASPGFFDSWVPPGVWAFQTLTPPGWVATQFLKSVYFMFDDAETEEDYVNVFRAWEADVEATVPPERLLKFSVKEGWEPLADFLGKEVPDEPFPHANSKEEFVHLQRLAIVGYTLVAVEIGLIAGLLYLGCRRLCCGTTHAPKAKSR